MPEKARAWVYRTDPQSTGGQFGTLSGLLRNTFRNYGERAKKYFRPKSFRTIFEKRTPIYSLLAPLLGLAKSIYYCIVLYCIVLYCIVLYCIALYCIALYCMVWYGMVWYGMVWYGMVWYGMVWYGMVWYGMVWYCIVSCCIVWRETCCNNKQTQTDRVYPCTWEVLGLHWCSVPSN